MGSYPSFSEGRISTQLVLRATNSKMLERARASLEAKLSGARFIVNLAAMRRSDGIAQ